MYPLPIRQEWIGSVQNRQSGDDDGMRSPFETSRQYRHDVPDDLSCVNPADGRTVLAHALEDHTALHGWQIELDGQNAGVREEDLVSAESLA